MGKIINFIQDVATPHNNVLLRALYGKLGFSLNVWYCQKHGSMYGWKVDLANAIKPALFYRHNVIDLKFVFFVLKNKKIKNLIVGWANPSAKLLILLFFILRKPYNMWIDLPDDTKKNNSVIMFFRERYYDMLKYSKVQVFCVGEIAVSYFKRRGFSAKKVINLPIFIDIPGKYFVTADEKSRIRQIYAVEKNAFFISAGSRLVYDKGYDLLIDAIASLDKKIKDKVKCVIVGKGEERANLQKRINFNSLQRHICIVEWMEIENFNLFIAASDVFVHPARRDAYGGTIYALAVGVPVIGSASAGAALDRIKHGENGFLVHDNSVCEYAKYLEELFYLSSERKEQFGLAAINEAKKWPAERGVEILLNNLI